MIYNRYDHTFRLVEVMTISIIIEPEYRDTVWCRETLRGIEKKVASLRYRTKICSCDTLGTDAESVIIIGTSPSFVSAVLDRTVSLGVRSVAVSCQPMEADAREKTSYVLIDHSSATKECIEYLQGCGRTRIALYGINLNSYADMIKIKYFDDENIYYCHGKDAMRDCYESFRSQAEQYNAVVCSNYISAIYLMDRLKKDGITVPQNLYIAAYGDSIIGNMFAPSLTTVTLDHEMLGIQAVNLCRFHDFSAENVNVTVRVPCEIRVAGSTENMPYVKGKSPKKNDCTLENIFRDNEQIKEIQSLEKLLRICDAADFEIINCLLDGKSYNKIGDSVYMSEGSVKYRVKRLLGGSGIESIAKMLDLYKKYISENKNK